MSLPPNSNGQRPAQVQREGLHARKHYSSGRHLWKLGATGMSKVYHFEDQVSGPVLG